MRRSNFFLIGSFDSNPGHFDYSKWLFLWNYVINCPQRTFVHQILSMPRLQIFLTLIFSLALCMGLTGCHGQNNAHNQITTHKNKMVGGGCDGCNLMFEGMPANIVSSDKSIAWKSKAQQLIIQGTVFRPDGKTPAPGVIIYYWHTDVGGRYPSENVAGKKATRHGSIRGWMKTDLTGNFVLYTGRPAPYPASDIPAHVHFVVKESHLNEYYTDELVFDDDALLTVAKRKRLENRGGSGIVKTRLVNQILTAQHIIMLGLNIPDYPVPVK